MRAEKRIEWRRAEAGLYESADGRFTIRTEGTIFTGKGSGRAWRITDTNGDSSLVDGHSFMTLKRAKEACEDQLRDET